MTFYYKTIIVLYFTFLVLPQWGLINVNEYLRTVFVGIQTRNVDTLYFSLVLTKMGLNIETVVNKFIPKKGLSPTTVG